MPVGFTSPLARTRSGHHLFNEEEIDAIQQESGPIPESIGGVPEIHVAISRCAESLDWMCEFADALAVGVRGRARLRFFIYTLCARKYDDPVPPCLNRKLVSGPLDLFNLQCHVVKQMTAAKRSSETLASTPTILFGPAGDPTIPCPDRYPFLSHAERLAGLAKGNATIIMPHETPPMEVQHETIPIHNIGFESHAYTAHLMRYKDRSLVDSINDLKLRGTPARCAPGVASRLLALSRERSRLALPAYAIFLQGVPHCPSPPARAAAPAGRLCPVLVRTMIDAARWDRLLGVQYQAPAQETEYTLNRAPDGVPHPTPTATAQWDVPAYRTLVPLEREIPRSCDALGGRVPNLYSDITATRASDPYLWRCGIIAPSREDDRSSVGHWVAATLPSILSGVPPMFLDMTQTGSGHQDLGNGDVPRWGRLPPAMRTTMKSRSDFSLAELLPAAEQQSPSQPHFISLYAVATAPAVNASYIHAATANAARGVETNVTVGSHTFRLMTPILAMRADAVKAAADEAASAADAEAAAIQAAVEDVARRAQSPTPASFVFPPAVVPLVNALGMPSWRLSPQMEMRAKIVVKVAQHMLHGSMAPAALGPLVERVAMGDFAYRKRPAEVAPVTTGDAVAGTSGYGATAPRVEQESQTKRHLQLEKQLAAQEGGASSATDATTMGPSASAALPASPLPPPFIIPQAVPLPLAVPQAAASAVHAVPPPADVPGMSALEAAAAARKNKLLAMLDAQKAADAAASREAQGPVGAAADPAAPARAAPGTFPPGTDPTARRRSTAASDVSDAAAYAAGGALAMGAWTGTMGTGVDDYGVDSADAPLCVDDDGTEWACHDASGSAVRDPHGATGSIYRGGTARHVDTAAARAGVDVEHTSAPGYHHGAGGAYEAASAAADHGGDRVAAALLAGAASRRGARVYEDVARVSAEEEGLGGTAAVNLAAGHMRAAPAPPPLPVARVLPRETSRAGWAAAAHRDATASALRRQNQRPPPPPPPPVGVNGHKVFGFWRGIEVGSSGSLHRKAPPSSQTRGGVIDVPDFDSACVVGTRDMWALGTWPSEHASAAWEKYTVARREACTSVLSNEGRDRCAKSDLSLSADVDLRDWPGGLDAVTFPRNDDSHIFDATTIDGAMVRNQQWDWDATLCAWGADNYIQRFVGKYCPLGLESLIDTHGDDIFQQPWDRAKYGKGSIRTAAVVSSSQTGTAGSARLRGSGAVASHHSDKASSGTAQRESNTSSRGRAAAATQQYTEAFAFWNRATQIFSVQEPLPRVSGTYSRGQRPVHPFLSREWLHHSPHSQRVGMMAVHWRNAVASAAVAALLQKYVPNGVIPGGTAVTLPPAIFPRASGPLRARRAVATSDASIATDTDATVATSPASALIGDSASLHSRAVPSIPPTPPPLSLFGTTTAADLSARSAMAAAASTPPAPSAPRLFGSLVDSLQAPPPARIPFVHDMYRSGSSQAAAVSMFIHEAFRTPRPQLHHPAIDAARTALHLASQQEVDRAAFGRVCFAIDPDPPPPLTSEEKAKSPRATAPLPQEALDLMLGPNVDTAAIRALVAAIQAASVVNDTGDGPAQRFPSGVGSGPLTAAEMGTHLQPLSNYVRSLCRVAAARHMPPMAVSPCQHSISLYAHFIMSRGMIAATAQSMLERLYITASCPSVPTSEIELLVMRTSRRMVSALAVYADDFVRAFHTPGRRAGLVNTSWRVPYLNTAEHQYDQSGKLLKRKWLASAIERMWDQLFAVVPNGEGYRDSFTGPYPVIPLVIVPPLNGQHTEAHSAEVARMVQDGIFTAEGADAARSATNRARFVTASQAARRARRRP